MATDKSLEEELNYVIAKMDDEIAELSSHGGYELTAGAVADLQKRRDQHYERLTQIDGITPQTDT